LNSRDLLTESAAVQDTVASIAYGTHPCQATAAAADCVLAVPLDWRQSAASADRVSVMTYDIVIRGGTVGTAADVFEADVAISGESIAAIGKGLGPGKREIDAKGKLVLPGGVDAHAHIEQLSGMGITNADTFESGTKSAAYGGTTTVICFAAQHTATASRRSSRTITGSPARAL